MLITIYRYDHGAEASVLGPPDAKSQLIGKDTDAKKDWRQEEKAMIEDEMVGWHHQLNGHEFEQVPGVGEGQGNLACCSPWGHRESDKTEWLNNNKYDHVFNSLIIWVTVSVDCSVPKSCLTLWNPMDCAYQASLSFTISWSLLKFTSIESGMLSNHLIPCHPFLCLPSVFPSIVVFSRDSAFYIRWPKYWSFSFSISPFNEYSRLMDWLDFLAVRGTLNSLLQHHSSKASILWCSAFFMVQP